MFLEIVSGILVMGAAGGLVGAAWIACRILDLSSIETDETKSRPEQYEA